MEDTKGLLILRPKIFTKRKLFVSICVKKTLKNSIIFSVFLLIYFESRIKQEKSSSTKKR